MCFAATVSSLLGETPLGEMLAMGWCRKPRRSIRNEA